MFRYKLGIIGVCGLPANYGGFETLAENIVQQINSDSVRVLITAQKGYLPINQKNLRQIVLPLRANGIQSILFDFISMIICASQCECVLCLGVSGSLLLPILRVMFPYSRIITHIDGIEWQRPKWNKVARSFLYLSEKFAVHFSDYIITDNLGITEYVQKKYGKRISPRCMSISYGANPIPKRLSTKASAFMQIENVIDSSLDSSDNYFLVIARAEPENNIELIIIAYLKSKPSFCLPTNLIIVSNAESTLHGQRLIEKYSSCPGVIFTKPIYDKTIIFNIRSHALAYIHGHQAGGTNPSLVEAIAANRPIAAYDVSFNRHTTANHADYFKDSDSLSILMLTYSNTSISLPESLLDLLVNEYSWPNIADKYLNLLTDLTGLSRSNTRYLTRRLKSRLKLINRK